MGSLRTRKNRGEQPRTRKGMREGGGVGGYMWVPARRGTQSVCERERERSLALVRVWV